MTCAEGAMFVTDDEALATRVRMLKFHGLGVDAYDRLTHGRKPQAQVMERDSSTTWPTSMPPSRWSNWNGWTRSTPSARCWPTPT
jgi:hypothetical protein